MTSKDRPAFMFLGSIVAGTGMAISMMGQVTQNPIIMGIGLLAMLRGMTWVFWGGN